MGKGDRRSRRGKLFRGSHGKSAPAAREEDRGQSRAQGRSPAQAARQLSGPDRVFDPSFWEALWKQAAASSPVARRDLYDPREELAYWDRRAEGYDRQSRSPDSRAWRGELLRLAGSARRPAARLPGTGHRRGPGQLRPAPGRPRAARHRAGARRGHGRNPAAPDQAARPAQPGRGPARLGPGRAGAGGLGRGLRPGLRLHVPRGGRAAGPGADEPGLPRILLPRRLVRRAVGAVGPGAQRAVAPAVRRAAGPIPPRRAVRLRPAVRPGFPAGAALPLAGKPPRPEAGRKRSRNWGSFFSATRR